MREGFHTLSIKLASAPQVPAPPPVTNPPTSGVSGVGEWIGDKLSDGARFIFEPIGNALKELMIGGIHVLPIVLVVAGLCCFILTIMLAHRKPYFWGLACWAASAVVRVISHEFGI